MVRFVGYHGTTLQNAYAIVREGFHRKSIGDRHWLGDGYYFFESSEGWARWWTRQWTPPRESAVVRAEIWVARENVLDLLDYDDMELFHAVRTKIIQELRSRRKRVWIQKPFDGYVLNVLCNTKGFRLVRAAFPEPDDHRDRSVKRNESRIRRIHVQLCCRDRECIRNLSIVDTIA